MDLNLFQVIWFHNDRPVKESKDFQLLFEGDRCSLIIREVYLEDSGDYRCFARNQHGQAESKCRLAVDREFFRSIRGAFTLSASPVTCGNTKFHGRSMRPNNYGLIPFTLPLYVSLLRETHLRSEVWSMGVLKKSVFPQTLSFSENASSARCCLQL